MAEIHPDDQFYLARKADTLRLRATLISGIRRFFADGGFLEIDTPLRVPSPAPEEHIEALPSGDWFLQTSPELCMKRIVAAGYPNIFQICKCFRARERGNRHLPEFTMLEWYVAGFTYHQLMDQCQTLLETVLKSAIPYPALTWENRKIDFRPPWEKITVADAFSRFAPIPLDEALKTDHFDEILMEFVEPHLGFERPTFLFDYPASLGALALTKSADPSIAERFELYIGGIELANGFSELTDPAEQRQRFEDALEKRAAKNWARYEMPEKFLNALGAMPPCAGVALGVDRLIMLVAGTDLIDDVIAFPPEHL